MKLIIVAISILVLSGCSLMQQEPQKANVNVYFSEFDIKVCAQDLSAPRCEFLKQLSAYELIKSTQRQSSAPVDFIADKAEGLSEQPQQ